MLGFGRGEDVAALIAKRKYAQAIDILSEQVRTDPDPRARLQLADVLALAGRPKEAVPVLMRLADDYVAQGGAAKAIALLKKVQRLDPARKDVEERLATVIKQPRATAAPGSGLPAAPLRPKKYAPREGADKLGWEPSGAVFGAEHFDPGLKYSSEERIEAARGASWVPDTREDAPSEVPYYSAQMTSKAEDAAPAEVPAEPVPVEVAPEVEPEVTAEPLEEAPIPEMPESEVAESPLFSSLELDELVAVIHGLRLLDFEPGDIVLTQGDPGDSLFVVTTGLLKTFIKDPEKPRQLMVRTLADGDFFGEISILSGRPRTATVTAASRCELLELDKAALDEICLRHPRVREVLEEFYVQRATTQAEAMQRAQQLRDGR